MIIDSAAIAQTHSGIIDEDKRQVMFTYIPKLKKLSMVGNTTITENVDLTSNPLVNEVYLSDTNLNTTLPANPIITKLSLGTPTEVKLINPTRITVSNTTVQDPVNLNSIELINIPENRTFAMFDKIMT